MAQTISLRLRIAIWYGGLTGVVISLVCVYSYALHCRTRYDALDNMLQRDALHIAAELADARTPLERDRTLAAFVLLGAGGRVYDARGALLQDAAPRGSSAAALDPRRVLSTGTIAAYPAIAAIAPALFSESTGVGAFTVLYDASGERWRAFVLPMAGGNQYLAATLPMARIDRAIAGFGGLMLTCAVLASIATFLVGWLLARHALRPVAVLTAGAIAQSRAISRRVPDHGDGDELHSLASTFNEMLGSQEDAYESQQRFIAAASHELRAPLTVVLANLELLQLAPVRGMSDDERAQAVGEAHSEAARMARLVADLLSLARADAGVPLRREPVELDRVLIDVIGELRHEMCGQQLAVAAFEPVTVQGDPDRLKQLILILLDNAIKYTAPGGSVNVSLQRDQGNAIIEVCDTGVGIAPDDLARVFERFYRADPSRSRNAGGTGLGLSIARWIAEEHEGTVALVSALGRGTTATVRMPVPV